MAKQADFFASASGPAWPAGLRYREDFLSPVEEQALLAQIAALPFAHSIYRQYTARRRTVSYGAGYDFQHHSRTPAPELPAFLLPLRQRVADWLDIDPCEFVQALISEYQPGTPLGWHRDVPDYEQVVAVSLRSACRIRFRRYPWNPAEKADIFAIEPQPRSAYVLSGEARWKWQHSVPAVKELRYSITLRTLVAGRRPLPADLTEIPNAGQARMEDTGCGESMSGGNDGNSQEEIDQEKERRAGEGYLGGHHEEGA